MSDRPNAALYRGIQLGAALGAPILAVANMVAPGMIEYWFLGVQVLFAAYVVAGYLETDDQTERLMEALDVE